MASRLAHIERLVNELEDDESLADEDTKEAEELRLAIKALESEKTIILREGLVFDFPAPLSIIPDPKCSSLKGWVGADWIAEEIFLTTEEVKELFNLDLQDEGINYKRHSTSSANYTRNPRQDLPKSKHDLACCWVMWHKPSGLRYTMIDGYKDFAEEPGPPNVALERFFPVYAFCYNELEHPEDLFPESDVRQIMHAQMELNRTRQAIREHRIANRPGYVTPRGSMSEEDKEELACHEPHSVIELDNMAPGQKIADMLQGIPKVGIDPNLYDTAGVMNDVFLAVGANEATFGTTSGATATESAIAEASRTGAQEAEIDELNDFLTEIARDAGQVMLLEHSVEQVRELVGEGAVWPEMSQESVQKELYLDVVAGSNGRPNRARRQQALQQLAPFMMQAPGLNPEWFLRMLIEAVDDSIDLTEAISQSIPLSIQAMNNQPQITGTENDPAAQGARGASNAQGVDRPSQGAGPQGDRQRRPAVMGG